MYQIRRGVFETNSSSCHSIAIQKAEPNIKNSTVDFDIGEYGWEFGCADPSDYLWTALWDRYEDAPGEIEWWKNQINTLAEQYGNHCVFHIPESDDDENYMWCGIDHSYDTTEMIEGLRRNPDQLARFIFGGASCVYTGNDNSDEFDSMCWCADPVRWRCWEDEDGWHEEETLNPDHDEENFEYYFKGN